MAWYMIPESMNGAPRRTQPTWSLWFTWSWTNWLEPETIAYCMVYLFLVIDSRTLSLSQLFAIHPRQASCQA